MAIYLTQRKMISERSLPPDASWTPMKNGKPCAKMLVGKQNAGDGQPLLASYKTITEQLLPPNHSHRRHSLGPSNPWQEPQGSSKPSPLLCDPLLPCLFW